LLKKGSGGFDGFGQIMFAYKVKNEEGKEEDAGEGEW
jgi:hypothetical protein